MLVDLMLTYSIFKWQNVISIGVITKKYIITRTGIKCIVDRKSAVVADRETIKNVLIIFLRTFSIGRFSVLY